MKKTVLFALWGGLFVISAALGLADNTKAGLWVSILFFLPPSLLLYDAGKAGDKSAVLLIRNLAALSLGLTLVLLIFNVVFAVKSQAVGNFLHGILGVVSTPMLASGYWALSLFLWACLLMVGRKLAKKL